MNVRDGQQDCLRFSRREETEELRVSGVPLNETALKRSSEVVPLPPKGKSI